jgi:biopolymer transport protein ExbD
MGRHLFFNRGSLLEEKPEVNLTPLIDVVFVILIMFILVAPLLDIDNVDLADASGAPKETITITQEMSEITIYVHRDNTVTFNKQPVSIDRLKELLKESKKRYPKARPQIFHDRKANFGTYQSIKNAVEGAGFEEMDIVLKPS